VEVGFTYLSKIENGKLEDGHSPSDHLLVRMAEELAADATELLLLAERIPDPIRRSVIQRPEAFAALAKLEDDELDRLLKRTKVLTPESAWFLSPQLKRFSLDLF
jgi:transcriptional regulator with XRE-family HTH domain